MGEDADSHCLHFFYFDVSSIGLSHSFKIGMDNTNIVFSKISFHHNHEESVVFEQ